MPYRLSETKQKTGEGLLHSFSALLQVPGRSFSASGTSAATITSSPVVKEAHSKLTTTTADSHNREV